ncbi:glycosyltransferase 87 family protein [Amycolatopsis endophytica]|uniref:Alpha-1,2-mannosyltransferase n=1 Tax=Amycolatopsis endophytica TaxID=860233 RepID=A0A853B6R3_9PSEU|nr:glycosyltransferase family 87 protein [Amycolatopsis endophytica]NYI90680.1 alpha-1,2-mannosyltransferase [Amycolatopsis endophytica]
MRKYLWLVPVPCAVWLFFAVQGMMHYLPTRPQIDLEVYRYGVQAWWDGKDMYGTLPEVANGAELPFVYPPFAAVLLSPLAMLPWDASVVTLYILNGLALGVTLYLVARTVRPSLGRAGGVAVASIGLPASVFLEPVSQTFGFGQVSIIMMALVTVDCLAGRTVWPRGFGIGLAAAIKLTPAAFILYFLIRRDFRSAITAGITFAVASVIGFIADFGGSVTYWFQGGLSGGGVSGTAFATNQAIEAVIVRTGLTGAAEKAVWIVLVLGLLGLVANAMRRAEPALALMANAGLALLVSPTSWSHYYVWVVPALLVMLGITIRRAEERSWAAAAWLAWGALTAVFFILAPFHKLPETDFPVVHRDWTFPEQLSAATYVLVVVALLLAFAIPRRRHPRPPLEPVMPVGRPAGAATP